MSVRRDRFFDVVRARFGSLKQGQVDGFGHTLDAFECVEGLLLPQSAYVLGTFWHETNGAMLPVTERGSRDYIEQRYDPVRGSTPARRARAKKMGNLFAGSGWMYRGRGPVQVTWQHNYAAVAELLGLDSAWAIQHPEFMLDPQYAYRGSLIGMLTGLFTGKSLDDYINDRKTDYIGARRVVNGTDRAEQIAAYALLFERCLREAAP